MRPLAPVAIVESIHASAVREINALEQRIVEAEDSADARLWDQVRLVVEQLEAVLPPRTAPRENGARAWPFGDDDNRRGVRDEC
jgi:hypothetical protein